MTKTKSLYESDLVAWSEHNADLLRTGQFSKVDIENVAEEIASLGRSDKRQLESRIAGIIEHMLKLDLMTGEEHARNQRGWSNSIRLQRNGIQRLFEESPSLRALLTDGFLVKCYREGAGDFSGSDFGCYANPPRHCPWSWSEILEMEDKR